MLTVRKKDGAIEPFETGKIRAGMEKACEKRPVTAQQIDEVVLGIENGLRDDGLLQVTSEDIGQRVMAALRDLDEVAYVRFASVYQEFQEVGSFVAAVASLEEQPAAPRPTTTAEPQ